VSNIIVTIYFTMTQGVVQGTVLVYHPIHVLVIMVIMGSTVKNMIVTLYRSIAHWYVTYSTGHVYDRTNVIVRLVTLVYNAKYPSVTE